MRFSFGRFSVICVVSLSALFLMAGCSSENRDIAPSVVPPVSNATPTKANISDSIFISTDNRKNDADIVFQITDDLVIAPLFPNQFSNLQFLPDGCEWVDIFGTSNHLQIRSIDSNGGITEQREISFEDSPAGFQYLYSISPDKEWVAFKEAAGEIGQTYSDASVQNVKIVNIQSESGQSAKEITHHGGAFVNSLAWSPDGRFLSFSDFDEGGVPQIYIYDPHIDTVIQVSSFQEPHTGIVEIKWSYDSDYLAASVYDESKTETSMLQQNGRIFLFSPENQPLGAVDFGEKDPQRLSFWWGQNDRLLIYSQSTSQEYGKLSWYNPIDGSVEKKISLSSEDLQIRTHFAFPLSSDLTRVALVGEQVGVFDSENNRYFKIDSPDIQDIFYNGFYKFIETPGGGISIRGCD